MTRPVVAIVAIATAVIVGCAAQNARADDQWLPHPAHASWTYSWSDSVYSKTPTKEKVTVKSQTSRTFQLAWTTAGMKNPADAVTSSGTVDFQESDQGIVNTKLISKEDRRDIVDVHMIRREYTYPIPSLERDPALAV